MIYSVSYFDLGELGTLFGGLSPPKPPVATGLGFRHKMFYQHDLFQQTCKLCYCFWRRSTQKIISSKTVHFNTETSNLVILFQIY